MVFTKPTSGILGIFNSSLAKPVSTECGGKRVSTVLVLIGLNWAPTGLSLPSGPVPSPSNENKSASQDAKYLLSWPAQAFFRAKDNNIEL